MSTAKEELTRLIQKQPDDSSSEEIVRELAFHVMVQRGLADSDAQRTVSNGIPSRSIESQSPLPSRERSSSPMRMYRRWRTDMS